MFNLGRPMRHVKTFFIKFPLFMDSEKCFSMEEVRKHNREDDLWLIKDGKVYDLTSYYKFHPGGKAMLNYAGKDVTLVLANVMAHSFSMDFIESKLEELCIGRLKN